MGSSNLARMRREYLKKKGDGELKGENYGKAVAVYSEALAVEGAGRDGSHLILSNRSLALGRVGRFAEACEDARRALAIVPGWHKAHWRLASSLRGMKKHIEAVYEYKRCYDALGDEKAEEMNEVAKEMRRTVFQCRREELADLVVRRLQLLQDQGRIKAPETEDVSDEEKIEAAFRHIKASHQRGNSDENSSFYQKCFEWHLQDTLGESEAYAIRSAIYCRAKCLLQAQLDAKRAVASTQQYYASYKSSKSQHGAAMMKKYSDLAKAYFQLGIAYTCEGKDHTDVDLVEGVKCFTQACEYNGHDDEYQSKLKEQSDQLTPEQTQRVRDLLKEAQAGEYGQDYLFENVEEEELQVFELDAELTFNGATHRDLTAAAREELRKVFAKELQCKSLLEVQLSWIRKQDEALMIGLQIHAKCSEGDSRSTLVKEFAEKPSAAADVKAMLVGAEALRHLGEKLGCVSFDLRDMTQDLHSKQVSENFEFSHLVDGGAASAAAGEDEAALPSRPKTDIELPYKLYRLVKEDGSPCERADKHAFCMSRVYYSQSDLPQEVYVQLCDSSLRWRQSSDEVKIILLQVPPGLKASRDLVVEVLPDFLSCSHRNSGKVYFEGQLCRGVIPEQCLWEYEGDSGHVTFYLKKMNLELLSKSHQHAEMWWPKLCAHHSEIQWDDYEKDYSDLPSEIMKQHANREEQSKLLNDLEYKERMKKEQLQECDDLRKRLRQERLAQMRVGIVEAIRS
mmetsp:Transcript_2366/g.5467  ORF Transcript_2366/g.5467 Transcript_2366/m.5467 type:complete len:737 (-) Transcript_2366:58-2268(-)